MPGDLSNPEEMFPYHYDSKYEPGTTVFEPRALNLQMRIQEIVKGVRGYPLSKDDVDKLWEFLEEKHLLQINPGDPRINDAVMQFLKMQKKSRKVAFKWLT